MKKDSKGNQAKYVELNLFPEEIEDHQKDSISSDSKENHTSSDKEYDLTDLFEKDSLFLQKQDHLHTKSVSSLYQDLAFAEWGSLHYHYFMMQICRRGVFLCSKRP